MVIPAVKGTLPPEHLSRDGVTPPVSTACFGLLQLVFKLFNRSFGADSSVAILV